jgi:cell fate regulator YaaT (PSP1 superfamily)
MNLAKVCLRSGRKCTLVSPVPEGLRPGDLVMVETEEGLVLGRVNGIFPNQDPAKWAGKPKRLVRLATPEDLAQDQKNRRLEKRAAEFCRSRIEARQLPIYLVEVRCLFEASKLIFYFTAPGRVDFRELVKELVQEFRTRIELRQIGVRHRARMVGGLGICGRPLCCGDFLQDFEPVSVRMAKEQQLSLNPSKISGICGRLMCCLAYEYPSYQELRRHLPKVGKRISLPEGEAKVIRYNFIRQTVTVEMQDGREVELALAELPSPAPPQESV